MKITAAIVPIATLALAMGSVTAEGAQRERRSDRATQRADRGRQQAQTDRRSTRRNEERSAQRTERRRDNSGRSERKNHSVRGRGNQESSGRRSDVDRSRQGAARPGNRDIERPRAHERSQARSPRPGFGSYYAPRIVPRHLAPRRIYGSGGRLSLYFGWGSGYRYGSPYYGRVYGYRAPLVTGHASHRYYGDLRLKITPRHAAVYVDGYYAGVVDDFDGFFQRLTLEVGPHLIEVEAPGLESQVFDVYVDPRRTIDLHGDLRRY